MFKMFSITLLGLLTVSAVRAQSSKPLEAKIPFDFTVNNTTLEAGNYRLTYNLTSQILRIEGRDHLGASVAILAGVSAPGHSPVDSGALVFQCNDGDCHLARVWQGASGGGTGLQIPQPHQKNAVARTTQPTLVTIPTE